MDRPVNALGQPLERFSTQPMTGFFRDGYCNTSPADLGSHTVAAVVNDKWLDFSASRGNDLRGMLSGGCKWCLCAARWKESLDAFKRGEVDRDTVPRISLASTHHRALEKVSLDDLRAFSVERQDSSPAAAPSHPSQGGPIR